MLNIFRLLISFFKWYGREVESFVSVNYRGHYGSLMYSLFAINDTSAHMWEVVQKKFLIWNSFYNYWILFFCITSRICYTNHRIANLHRETHGFVFSTNGRGKFLFFATFFFSVICLGFKMPRQSYCCQWKTLQVVEFIIKLFAPSLSVQQAVFWHCKATNWWYAGVMLLLYDFH